MFLRSGVVAIMSQNGTFEGVHYTHVRSLTWVVEVLRAVVTVWPQRVNLSRGTQKQGFSSTGCHLLVYAHGNPTQPRGNSPHACRTLMRETLKRLWIPKGSLDTVFLFRRVTSPSTMTRHQRHTTFFVDPSRPTNLRRKHVRIHPTAFVGVPVRP